MLCCVEACVVEYAQTKKGLGRTAEPPGDTFFKNKQWNPTFQKRTDNLDPRKALPKVCPIDILHWAWPETVDQARPNEYVGAIGSISHIVLKCELCSQSEARKTGKRNIWVANQNHAMLIFHSIQKK